MQALATRFEKAFPSKTSKPHTASGEYHQPLVAGHSQNLPGGEGCGVGGR